MPIDNLDFSIVEDCNGMLLESAQIDLEFSKQLLPSPTRSDIIERHLDAIRSQFPNMNDIKHNSKWIAGRLVLTNCKKTIDECTELINASEYGPLVGASLYGETEESFLFSFDKPYNPEILGPMIANLCECSTEPNFGADGNIEINVFGENEAKYTFSITNEKSAAGYRHFWKYSVTAQGVNFIVHLENEWEKELLRSQLNG